jgi:FkbM family methyltransferase
LEEIFLAQHTEEPMPFISYAQNYEDVVLWRALRGVEHGFYVDVGAADPEEASVTRAFYDRGWSGTNLEPLDEYFNKLTKARPRDTNLKVAVGREAGVRTLHTFPSGLSTLSPQLSARHQAAGWEGHETVVPVLTLTKILEDCAPPTIHFLKIDVEGAEAEVVEGLDLDRFRPWIIVIEATEPNSTVSTRDDWEHLIIGHGYGLAYFDGLNCFYVADEIAGLKEGLAVPPNVFDDFVRWSEWFHAEKAATLDHELSSLQGHALGLTAALQAEQAQSAYLRNTLQAEQMQAANLRNALQAEQMQAANLRNALQAEQGQAANLRNALQAEQVQVANLTDALRTEHAQMDRLDTRIRNLETQLAVPSIDRATGRVLSRLHKTGDRLTGGGIRASAKRVLIASIRRSLSLAVRHPRLAAIPRGLLKPFPKLTAVLYQLVAPPDRGAATAASAAALPVETGTAPVPSEDPMVAALPASARSAFLKLKTAASRENT